MSPGLTAIMSTHQFRYANDESRSHCITGGELRIYCQGTNLGPYTASSGLISIRSEVFEISETFSDSQKLSTCSFK